MAKPYLSVIIPTSNSARTLPLTLIDIDHHLTKDDLTYEVLVVDDASSDATPEVVRRFSLLMKNIRLVELAPKQLNSNSRPQKRGIGAAVREGMVQARGSWRIVLYPANAVSVEEFHKAFPYLRSGYDVVFGSRSLMRSRVMPHLRFSQTLFRMLHNLLLQLIVVPRVWDTESGWYCFSETAAEQIFFLNKVDTAGWAVEALALARKLGFTFKEFPIYWVNTRPKQFDYRLYMESLVDALRVRWMLWSDAYKLKKR